MRRPLQWFWKDDGGREILFDRVSVALVNEQFLGIVDDAVIAHDSAQACAKVSLVDIGDDVTRQRSKDAGASKLLLNFEF